MIGPLYYRIKNPEQIKKMPWNEMLYWDKWNEAMEEETRSQISDVNSSGLNLKK